MNRRRNKLRFLLLSRRHKVLKDSWASKLFFRAERAKQARENRSLDSLSAPRREEKTGLGDAAGAHQ